MQTTVTLSSLLVPLDARRVVREEEEVYFVLWLGHRLIDDDVEDPGRNSLLQEHLLCLSASIATQQSVQRPTLHLAAQQQQALTTGKVWILFASKQATILN